MLELGLAGRRKALRSVIPLRGSGKNTRGASERVSHRARLFGACARRVARDDARGVDMQRKRGNRRLRTIEASRMQAGDFRGFTHCAPRLTSKWSSDHRGTASEHKRWGSDRAIGAIREEAESGFFGTPNSRGSVQELELGNRRRESAKTLRTNQGQERMQCR